MKHVHSSLNRIALAAALCTLASAQLAHAADTIASASISFNNIQYQLIDLDPNDGITPAVTFKGQWLGQLTEQGPLSASPDSGLSPSIAAPIITTAMTPQLMQLGTGAPPSTFPNSSGTLSFAQGGSMVSASARLTTDDMKSIAVTGAPSIYTYQTVDDQGRLIEVTDTSTSSALRQQGESRIELSAASLQSDPGLFYERVGAQVTLTPQTALVLYGQATMNMSVDRSNLVNTTKALQQAYLAATGNTEDNSFNYYAGSALSQIGLSFDTAYDTSADNNSFSASSSGYAGWSQYLDYDNTLFVTGYDPVTGELILDYVNMTKTIALSKGLSAQWSNMSGVAQNANLYVDMKASVSQSAIIEFSANVQSTTLVPDPSTVVPEPGTYALMGLGLIGIALVRRRQTA